MPIGLIESLADTADETISVCKYAEIGNFKVNFWKIFGGIAPHRPLRPIMGIPQTIPSLPWRSSASRLARDRPSVPPSALPGNKADPWMHCLVPWSGAATGPTPASWDESWDYTEWIFFIHTSGSVEAAVRGRDWTSVTNSGDVWPCT